jgi:protein-S-isoprenylcysteine O-methyltransferase Ste14
MAGALEARAGTAPATADALLGGAWRAYLLRWRPPALVLGLSAAALAMHIALWRAEAPFGRAVFPGLALALAGLAWAYWAKALFRRAGTEILPHRPPRVFVDEGPFRFGRHPMYLGLAVLMLGVALASGSPFMLVASAGFIVLVSRVHIPHEEAQALRRFGGWYRDYMASVRRWV